MSEDAAPFRFHREVEVRFRDIDIGGHAHHSQLLVYFEEARAAYWREVVGRPGSGLDDIDYVLAEARIRFRRRILYPETLRVGVRVSRLGKKHFEMEYEVWSSSGELVGSGATTQIMYDYEAAAPKPIPDSVRRAIEALDGPFAAGGRPDRGKESGPGP